MSEFIKELKVTIKNPGNAFMYHPRLRRFYNDSCDFLLKGKHKRRDRLAAALPEIREELKISKELGYQVVPENMNFPEVAPLLKRCQTIMADPSYAIAKVGKAYLNHLITPGDLEKFPEFLNLALNKNVLSIVYDYLGELPMLGAVSFWHAHTTVDEKWTKSQLYHSDFDDIRQVKLFLFADAVEENSGPFTFLPAGISDNIRQKLNNNNNNYGGYIEDEKICPHIPQNSEKILIGPAGTVAFVDTSRNLHYGSRVSGNDRYLVVFQYLSITNFVFNPLYRFAPYPFAHLVKDDQDPVIRAVLDPSLKVRTNGE